MGRRGPTTVLARFALALGLALAMLVLPVLPVGAGAAEAAPRASVRKPVPVLAYYYIWFTPGSWNRAKTDLPSLGTYSSDDVEVMRQHVRWAKQAGVDGFVVSWKNTEVLSRRLDKLVRVAREEDFKLSIIYQGLNFERRPLPSSQIAADLDYFAGRYAGDEVFGMFGKPVVVWSGTWEFSREDIAQTVHGRRDRLQLLASERNLPGYQRLADLVDGNAYYWSSVDPERFPGYDARLAAFGAAVHAGGGLWIAPAAPGFDARLIGGTRVIDRKDGDTLRRQIDAAVKSDADAIGLISWNEFSENSHLEPSRNHGRRYLDVLADIHAAPAPQAISFDSSEPGTTTASPQGPLLVGGLALFTVSGLAVVARRSRARRRDRDPTGP
jgi:hypothetical protein